MSIRFSKNLFLTFTLLTYATSTFAQDKEMATRLLHPVSAIKPIDSKLTSEVANFDSTMVFKQTPNGDGLFKITGVDQLGGSLQLIGGENKIFSSKWTFRFGNEKGNLAGLTNIGHFGFIIAGQPCVDWLVVKIKAAIKDRSYAFAEDKIFSEDAVEGRVTYDPTTSTLMLLFIPNKPEH